MLNGYSAEEVAKILQAEGDNDISKRTINYYAFDKRLFEVSGSGKKIFTDADIDKIRAIRMLKNCTTYTLEQIKQIINKHSLEEVSEMCAKRVSDISAYYGAVNNSGVVKEPPRDYFSDSMILEDSVKPLVPGRSNPTVKSPPKLSENRIIKVNDDITLVVSPQVDTEKLTKLIKAVRNLE